MGSPAIVSFRVACVSLGLRLGSNYLAVADAEWRNGDFGERDMVSRSCSSWADGVRSLNFVFPL